MKKKLFITVLAAALVACGFNMTQTTAFAADSPGSGLGAGAGRAHGGLLQRLADKLNLTADQRTKIKGVLAGEKDNLTPLLGAIHDARKNLRSAIRASDASEAAVRAASAKVAAAEADLAVERMKIYGKIAPILTEAQRQQLADLQQNADDFVSHAIERINSAF